MRSEDLDELFAFVGFDESDEARLRTLHPLLAPHFEQIATTFYEAIVRDPKAVAVFENPQQTVRLHATLVDWMATGLLGPYDDRFYEKRSRIGRRHVTVGLPQQYMFVAMNVVRREYHERIDRLLPTSSARATARSVDKLLDIELAIMVRHYQLDSEERLLASERRIQADKIAAMQTLSAGLAHEIRNPLNAAKLQLEVLERRLRKQLADVRLLEPSERARNEIARLTALLDDFLSFARPNGAEPDEHDLARTVRDVVELERELARRRDIEITVIAPAELRAAVDRAKLHQVVLNLTRNAIEAAPVGGHVAVELVMVDHDPQAPAFELRVTDDGPGIPDEVRARIFEPFFSTKEGGTGLGMSIVHSLVGTMHGTIDLVTGPRGTRFVVRAPRGTR